MSSVLSAAEKMVIVSCVLVEKLTNYSLTLGGNNSSIMSVRTKPISGGCSLLQNLSAAKKIVGGGNVLVEKWVFKGRRIFRVIEAIATRW